MTAIISDVLCAVKPCSRDAVVRATAGCIHEHEITAPICQFHADHEASVLRMSCRQCNRRGHACPIQIVRRQELA